MAGILSLHIVTRYIPNSKASAPARIHTVYETPGGKKIAMGSKL